MDKTIRIFTIVTLLLVSLLFDCFIIGAAFELIKKWQDGSGQQIISAVAIGATLLWGFMLNVVVIKFAFLLVNEDE